MEIKDFFFSVFLFLWKEMALTAENIFWIVFIDISKQMNENKQTQRK